ncbi:MAG: fumarate reductase/succinate dehydrogenase flavoprotein subunit [candidate division KSB1 bacterium]|nr:fumarate reductase/succinate dehydrogenase flavoprotein subunit [candidate division KSB1 bacterium]MDZ7274974.1 fumarate reductase/succinate dehydrogenase flavoprotein subunit [candidate division KSB1 bacterium]MDZ7286575.1 fumarate reductase/succinate dehydrogenase flavoprotein subunit [candidate division KSB1 bacterium]MDZ7299261.1 fumarate reductase/succinate dehydrogenase flavoprotein subunit [candidate division KSB1 bacterium]MDZ7306079.1 fumarate reductase/succinate dehydrogenase flavo
MKLDAKIPAGPLPEKWDRHKFEMKLISPANKRKFEVIVVGSGLAGASAAASMAELGYRVSCFCFQDSPRRAHSIAAQGGINAAKNYQNDGDSVDRLFYDTIKGGDFRAREANVYRLAQVSGNIIDQCVAQGVPFAREYGGLLDNRSFGGAQVSRTFYARGQTGQQLLLGAYSALCRQIGLGNVKMYPRTEMLDLVVIDGVARGIITRSLVNGRIERHVADAVVLATGGYSRVYFLSTNAMGCNTTAIWRAYRRGAAFANPCFTQIHPTCIPVSGEHQSKLTLMSESLRNDGRIWVPKKRGDTRAPQDIPEDERDYYLERKYPSYGNLAPRDISSRAAKEVCDEGRGVGESKRGVYLDFSDAIRRLGENVIRERYGNLFDMYEEITGENPYRVPMRIYPAPHYTMGGLWVDYNLMSTIPGLFVIGEANFSDHGANRLGASALMQGLADGYFILPYTIGHYFATAKPKKMTGTDHAAFRQAEEDVTGRIKRLLGSKSRRTVDSFHRELGALMWERCGMSRNAAGLRQNLQEIPALREQYWSAVTVVGSNEEYNLSLEKALRVADFFELAELMCRDALERNESCGGHFREEYQTAEGEALRNDKEYCHVSVWEYQGESQAPVLHKEPLHFEYVQLAERSYK